MTLKKSLRLWAVALVLLALLCPSALAKVVSPGKDFYFLDDANVLSEALEGEIFFSNKLLYDACGAQIVVVTVDSTGREAIDDYAYDLFNSWGIGDAAKDNGFLLLLAIGDDDYYARTGSGLDSRFSASTIKEYYDQYLEADFAARNYEAGVKKFFEAVFERIAVTYNAEVTTAQGIADYKAYAAQNAAADNFGGYSGSRRNGAINNDYRSYDEDEDDGIGFGFILFVLVIILVIVLLSKGLRSLLRVGFVPPPPPTPVHFGYHPAQAPTRRSYGGFAPPRSAAPRATTTSSWSSGLSRSSSGSSRSSFGSSSRSSFGGGSGSRSSGFGGASGGGGRSSGGGAGRGRH